MLIVLQHSLRSHSSVINRTSRHESWVFAWYLYKSITAAARRDVRIACTIQDCCHARRHGTNAASSMELLKDIVIALHYAYTWLSVSDLDFVSGWFTSGARIGHPYIFNIRVTRSLSYCMYSYWQYSDLSVRIWTRTCKVLKVPFNPIYAHVTIAYSLPGPRHFLIQQSTFQHHIRPPEKYSYYLQW